VKNRKQVLADFYLDLLAIPYNDIFRTTHMHLYASVRHSLAEELGENEENVQRIFECMAAEDSK